ncbi:MAG: penicillin-binding protein 2 [Zymomonas mobilis subsp. pomaceae]|uniref:Peptidoglycan glycosyltransferase n=1 Tax=Zymomonas mobilis subsp. pomaceae (strain ATCC 29192 / DSM 22645 / JCM 10191 / CCUG 17912 / NBRC 13757 / NCIMB 11200 / NRRL B-4491 / Barker I) TaxID=579138 RepID=F8EVD4_ZYMMT|nr:penicillin-binding protein 2 [Zymomonas mobilis]AEI37341.1 Peptidoglycan glycosyltransferase [Zymomonas mobilis subsp. pomaceae ATCC 29192]MDX5948709.1 penicillin-binding protein 2 [Zymomonas mobilis subsp. pomaceae]GEB88514.1 peptidoglycan glycosyltransferase [Zymomonas mobilis subsp. pomaceae]
MITRLTSKKTLSSTDILTASHVRLMILLILFCGGIGLVIAKIIWLIFITGWGVEERRHPTPPLLARADIVDRNGRTLARTIDVWSVGIHPRTLHINHISDPDVLAANLAVLMPERTVDEYRKIVHSNRNFVYLRRHASPELVRSLNMLGEPAIDFLHEPSRLYPEGTLAAHVIGWIGEDGHGQSGMEFSLDKELTDPKRQSAPFMLSIDVRVQAAVEKALSTAMLKYSAVGATAIVLDVDSGEVLAMVSLPNFNPNDRSSSDPTAFDNKATLSVYELGSTFKPITMATAIQDGVVTSLAKRYDATEPLAVGRFHIHDEHAQKRWLDVPETLVHSSNIVTARIADELGPERMQAMFRNLNFDHRPAIELTARGRPIWPAFWARSTVMTTGYGHGIAVTPLHLTSAYAALVNGGIWRPATLLKRDADYRPDGRQVISSQNSATMRRLLRLIVTDGTGRRADAPGFRVGGKTGTADKAEKGRYNHGARVSTFAAVFPMDTPRYAVVAMLDNPQGTADTGGYATAGMVTAPIVNDIVQHIGPLLGIIPDPKRDLDLTDLRALLWKPPAKTP